MTRRFFGILVFVVVTGAVALPVLQNLRDEPRDGFPLSYYPAVSRRTLPGAVRFTYVVGIDLAGTHTPIPHAFWGFGELAQANRQLARVVRLGREPTKLYCLDIARRVGTTRDKRFEGVVRIAIVSATYRAADYFAGRTEPVDLEVHGSAGFERSRATDFPTWLGEFLQSRVWTPRAPARDLTPDVLRASLAAGRRYMLSNQKPAGNFHYMYDFVEQRMAPGDNQVRQAGALWGLALLHAHAPDAELRAALDRGIRFFLDHSKRGPRDSLFIAYPGETTCKTGTVALTALAIIERLRVDRTDADELERALDGYLRLLESMQLAGRRFAGGWSLANNEPVGVPSSYSDGEALLCMTKAAKYLGRDRLRERIEDTAVRYARLYTLEAWAGDPDSRRTKGFFQWGCMAFWEYHDAGWRDAELIGDATLALGWWMVHTHRTLERRRNTGYAFEGIIHAYRLARSRGHAHAVEEFGWTIDTGLHKLTTWQVGGPLADTNRFLGQHPTDDPLAVGGVMSAAADANLRIDVTQHQMHAVLLALEHVYR